MDRKDFTLRSSYLDSGERALYDLFRIDNFQIETGGLYYWNSEFHIYCLNITESQLLELNHYLEQHRRIGSNISLTVAIPENAVAVPERSEKEVALRNGAIVTLSDVISEIHLSFQTILKDYKAVIDIRNIFIHFIDEISDKTVQRLKISIDNMGLSLVFHFKQVEDLVSIKESANDDSMENWCSLVVGQLRELHSFQTKS